MKQGVYEKWQGGDMYSQTYLPAKYLSMKMYPVDYLFISNKISIL